MLLNLRELKSKAAAGYLRELISIMLVMLIMVFLIDRAKQRRERTQTALWLLDWTAPEPSYCYKFSLNYKTFKYRDCQPILKYNFVNGAILVRLPLWLPLWLLLWLPLWL